MSASGRRHPSNLRRSVSAKIEASRQRDIEAIERVVATLEHQQQTEDVDARYQTPNAGRPIPTDLATTWQALATTGHQRSHRPHRVASRPYAMAAGADVGHETGSATPRARSAPLLAGASDEGGRPLSAGATPREDRVARWLSGRQVVDRFTRRDLGDLLRR